MPVPVPIRLQKPFLLVYGINEPAPIELSKHNYQLGTIKQVWMGSTWPLETNVMFPTAEAMTLKYGTANYFYIDETTIIHYEELL